MSYETYALVRDVVAAREQPPIHVKGISREVVPYVVEGLLGAAGEIVRIVKLHERRPRPLLRPLASGGPKMQPASAKHCKTRSTPCSR